jgi:hypothetical protein
MRASLRALRERTLPGARTAAEDLRAGSRAGPPRATAAGDGLGPAAAATGADARDAASFGLLTDSEANCLSKKPRRMLAASIQRQARVQRRHRSPAASDAQAATLYAATDVRQAATARCAPAMLTQTRQEGARARLRFTAPPALCGHDDVARCTSAWSSSSSGVRIARTQLSIHHGSSSCSSSACAAAAARHSGLCRGQSSR